MNVPAVAQMAPDLIIKLQGGTMGFGTLARCSRNWQTGLRLHSSRSRTWRRAGSAGTAQKLQQCQQALEQHQAMVQKLTQEITTKKADLDSKERIAAADNQTKMAVEAQKANVDADRELALQVMKNAATIAVAHINASTKGVSLLAHAQEEQQALGHEAVSQSHAQAHDVALAAQEHEHEMEAARQAHEHALAQGEADVGQMAFRRCRSPTTAGWCVTVRSFCINLCPGWMDPANASVFDVPGRGCLRKIVGMLGLDDPIR